MSKGAKSPNDKGAGEGCSGGDMRDDRATAKIAAGPGSRGVQGSAPQDRRP